MSQAVAAMMNGNTKVAPTTKITSITPSRKEMQRKGTTIDCLPISMPHLPNGATNQQQDLNARTEMSPSPDLISDNRLIRGGLISYNKTAKRG